MVMYYDELIFFCSVTVYQKGQGHRSHESIQKCVLACILLICGTIGMNFGILQNGVTAWHAVHTYFDPILTF